MKTIAENPNGLHARYSITKADGSPCDPNAIYFVLRVDEGGSDPVHIKACRIALSAYCTAIQQVPRLQGLCDDLRKLLDEPKKCVVCNGRGSIEDEDGVWICSCQKESKE